MAIATKRTCKNGHSYMKSSDCPVCPICEAGRKPQADFLKKLASPARRALERENISTLKQLSQYSEKTLLSLHGLGPSAIPILKNELKEKGLSLKR